MTEKVDTQHLWAERRDEAVQLLREGLDVIEQMDRNSFASHANQIVPDFTGVLLELATSAEGGRSSDYARNHCGPGEGPK